MIYNGKKKRSIRAVGNLISSKRAKIYGDAKLNHERIAQFWSVILEQKITVEQVYQCMIAVKMSRLINSPKHLDSWVDIVGYAALAGEDDEWNEDDGEDRKDNSTISFEERMAMDVLDVDWNIPPEFPDLRHCSQIAVDLETRDPSIRDLGTWMGKKRG